MTDPTQLEALAQRCEQVAGPDRPLSWDVWDAMGKPVVDDWSKAGSAPAYTASVDAALTLVPEGWHYTIEPLDVWVRGSSCIVTAHMPSTFKGSPALALTAAALRAHAARELAERAMEIA